MTTQLILVDEHAKPCHDCGEMMNRFGIDLGSGLPWWFCPKHGYDFSEHWTPEERAEWAQSAVKP